MLILNEKTINSRNSLTRDHLSEPTIDEIAAEWNCNVSTRAHELEAEIDNTYISVIVPHFKNTLYRFAPPKAKILDVGCGLGYLTNLMANEGFEVAGIDIAEKAIDYAKIKFPATKFDCTNIIEFSKKNAGMFDICVANMVLHNLVDLNANLLAMYKLLKNGGDVIASIPNPKLWFIKHIHNEDFQYAYDNNEVYKVPFKIRDGATHPSLITYIHRPISLYNQIIENAGFEVVESKHPRLGNGQEDQDLLFCVWRKK
jgi:2-polyprenyl-3-methyl-5-hydroxy-6-metoxy-1,4-benzoquinol methylase